jgi:hypothetical protein
MSISLVKYGCENHATLTGNQKPKKNQHAERNPDDQQIGNQHHQPNADDENRSLNQASQTPNLGSQLPNLSL